MKAMYDMADKFINLANEINKSDKSANVVVAIRYAAARYCAFEASMLTKNLAEDKDKQLQLYTDDLRKMLQVEP